MSTSEHQADTNPASLQVQSQVVPDAQSEIERSDVSRRCAGAGLATTASVTPCYDHEGIVIYNASAEDVLPLIECSTITLISDPPYGIEAVLGMGGGTKGDGGMWKGVAIHGDDDTTLRDWACSLFGSWAVFGSPKLPAPDNTKTVVVWDKGEHTGAGDLRLPWKPSFDLVFIGGDGWRWHRRQGGIVKCNAVAGCVGNRNSGHRFHPFEKPVEIMRHFVGRATSEVICDPFMGSGTTLLAAKREGKRAIGIERERRYCDIAIERLRERQLGFAE